MLISDFVLDKDEAQILSKIQVGIDDTGSDGYSHTYDVMSQLKKVIRTDTNRYAILLAKVFFLL